MPIPMTNSVSTLVHSIGEFPPDAVVFGKSESMQALRARMDKVASANVPVLINGESGTGKDIIARMIHNLSPWRSGPFVKVNCPAIPGTLLESELFGYEKGAFTGAYGMKPGRVEMAHRGTLFLDEISELDLALQSKLLQLLQDGQFCRIGAQEDKKVEVRIVCATNRQLDRRNREWNLPSGFVLPHQRGKSAHATLARAHVAISKPWFIISSNITTANTIAAPARFPWT